MLAVLEFTNDRIKQCNTLFFLRQHLTVLVLIPDLLRILATNDNPNPAKCG
ncbi:hypothetical protein AB32_3895 [Escherichia coli 2-316-03_S1_C2]|nr:hypothetical protein AC12_3919 [Escherichia coli 2-005-03_S3_C2]KEJ22635.1 hypothetical protein AB03_3957 [Escherichia coli 2-316-03_S1_C1]KEJ24034.1 hypothetical protein AB32_3895 [Escherichia coli 2-316-03_S1_C2]